LGDFTTTILCDAARCRGCGTAHGSTVRGERRQFRSEPSHFEDNRAAPRGLRLPVGCIPSWGVQSPYGESIVHGLLTFTGGKFLTCRNLPPIRIRHAPRPMPAWMGFQRHRIRPGIWPPAPGARSINGRGTPVLSPGDPEPVLCRRIPRDHRPPSMAERLRSSRSKRSQILDFELTPGDRQSRGRAVARLSPRLLFPFPP